MDYNVFYDRFEKIRRKKVQQFLSTKKTVQIMFHPFCVGSWKDSKKAEKTKLKILKSVIEWSKTLIISDSRITIYMYYNKKNVTIDNTEQLVFINSIYDLQRENGANKLFYGLFNFIHTHSFDDESLGSIVEGHFELPTIRSDLILECINNYKQKTGISIGDYTIDEIKKTVEENKYKLMTNYEFSSIGDRYSDFKTYALNNIKAPRKKIFTDKCIVAMNDVVTFNQIKNFFEIWEINCYIIDAAYQSTACII